MNNIFILQIFLCIFYNRDAKYLFSLFFSP